MIKMPNWAPALTDFEEQQLELQPDCDTTINAYYGPNILNPARLTNDDEYNQAPPNEAMMRDREISLVQNIRSTMNPDAFVGRPQLTIEDTEAPGCREGEIISMIRQAGMGPSVDEGLCSSRTIPAIESDRPYSSRGKFPVLYAESHFKLKLRKPGSESSSSMNSSNEENIPENNNKTVIKDSTSAALANKLQRCTLDSPSKETRSNENLIDINVKSPRKSTVEKFPSNKKKTSKIAANFSGLSANKSTPSGSSPSTNKDEKRHSTIKFVTPAELYKRKRKNSSEAQIEK